MDNKRIARIVLVALLAIGCFLILRPFVAAILFAAIVCVTTWPLHAWLLGRLGNRPAFASTLMILLLMLVVLLPMFFLAASVADAVPLLVGKLRAFVEHAAVAPPDWLARIPLAGEQLDEYWRRLAASREELNVLLKQFYDPTRRLLLRLVTLTGEGLLQLVLVLFIAFFFYRDGPLLAERLRSGSHMLADELGDQMLALTRSTVMGVMVGIVGTAAAQALVALAGFLIAGVPGAMLLAAATFFLSMIPVGPPLIWGGAAFWLYDQGQTGWAIFMAVYGIAVISSVDNFVKPLLISRTASLPILLIALGVFGGVLAFGFIGIFLGPVLLALGLVLAEKWTAAQAAAAPQP
ncbi:MAG: AI-2E family transporter [Rhodocyclaceae bacterium]|jgi:predicted PurR-regulated permease PerM|uniref:AI-2E family transporter n=1 Tax=Candidatus Desulfobacillus denitrificans TaxID=2608985 RepID=A0A809S0K0_9PROT|nr:AI-2E family transporter [Zoogloeaceae bacterium]MBP9653086.1 AI-2E family transporter [Rhodocyclaceae bacterium]MCZ2174257.1 AI-2E family transporter [Burkholderiales bacterium]OQY65353.1 MAG: AI-2E family transporter [Rhodocyclaceae bacterium UTPRO2]BBO22057.1 AI-2E family transporter [Candidatus Desulfobacillus denitrificans]GIK46879.1 MAG: AI-2E family transporter [Betaproteobacteria bacterium]